MAHDEEIDVGPLTTAQLQGLARDLLAQLRKIADDLDRQGVKSSYQWMIDRLENQLCGELSDENPDSQSGGKT